MNHKYIFLILVFVIAPVIIIYLESKFSVVKKIGAVLICYGIGLIIGNIGILPEGADKYQDILSTVTVPLALPLILFSMDVKGWVKLAGTAVKSLIIGVLSVVAMLLVGFWIFRDDIENAWQVAGMLAGVWTGGTPNMAALKTALHVSNELYLMTHTYEVTFGALYLLFILSIAQKVFLTFLPAFKSSVVNNQKYKNLDLEEEFESYTGFFNKKTFFPLLVAFGISVTIMGISYLLGKLVPEEYTTAATILLITTFGIACSFVPKINSIKKTFQLGMYIILIFCIVVASMAEIKQLANISFSLFYYIGLAMFGSHFLFAFIARFFKLDADTVIISGIALICSPPFVPPVAGALKNREIILTGLIIGIVGYAIGNYLGVFLAYALR